MRNLLAAYHKGATTAGELVIESLRRIDPASPELVLRELPDEIREKIRQFLDDSARGRMISNHGLLPAADQIAAAARWIDSVRQHVP